ncbi:hypothetical protein KM043_016747 [Ampulex compressa]|nr:hypothetical protein KM043_016747 [Ampulex compressa]
MESCHRDLKEDWGERDRRRKMRRRRKKSRSRAPRLFSAPSSLSPSPGQANGFQSRRGRPGEAPILTPSSAENELLAREVDKKVADASSSENKGEYYVASGRMERAEKHG